MKTHLVAAILSAGATAVADAQQPWLLDRYAEPVAALRGRELSASPTFAVPGHLARVGSRLIVGDLKADRHFSVFDTRTGRLLAAFGRTGGGPGEYQAPTSIDPDPRDTSAFWVYDNKLRRLTRVQLAAGTGANDPTLRTVQIETGATLTSVHFTAHGDFLSPGMFAQGRIAVFDSGGRALRSFGPLPPGEDKLPPKIRQMAYQSKIALNASRTKLALVTRYADRIELYDVGGRLLAQPSRPFSFEPKFRILVDDDTIPVMGSNDDMRFGYVDVAANDANVFALFSGRTRGGFRGTAHMGNYVHVYDWSGKRVKVLKLDATLIAIAISADGRQLYGIRHDPEPAIVVYDLR